MVMLADIHNHSLFGLDDGAVDIDTSLAMLAASYAEGVRVICLTPHYNPDLFPESTLARARSNFAELSRAAHERFPDLTLTLGMEYCPNFPTADPFLSDEAAPLGEGKWVLAEFSPQVLYATIRNSVMALQQAGYRVLIAHAERYECLLQKPDRVEELDRMHVKIQVNASSLARIIPTAAARFCHRLVRRGLVFAVASDAHGLHRRPPRLLRAYQRVAKRYGIGVADNLFYYNPFSILNIVKRQNN